MQLRLRRQEVEHHRRREELEQQLRQEAATADRAAYLTFVAERAAGNRRRRSRESIGRSSTSIEFPENTANEKQHNSRAAKRPAFLDRRARRRSQSRSQSRRPPPCRVVAATATPPLCVRRSLWRALFAPTPPTSASAAVWSQHSMTSSPPATAAGNPNVDAAPTSSRPARARRLLPNRRHSPPQLREDASSRTGRFSSCPLNCRGERHVRLPASPARALGGCRGPAPRLPLSPARLRAAAPTTTHAAFIFLLLLLGCSPTFACRLAADLQVAQLE
ncbi:hypothetical protein QYE76_046899 [Lolium multiflorum]|uniref:Uncharacterized protein n=1 Tax=Lolium multiflorum TaxID=4521 RepID=A0AAD8TQV4_LOLMU|nr:hypothetical protein QYE76_046899 [Lolium multiflorum]